MNNDEYSSAHLPAPLVSMGYKPGSPKSKTNQPQPVYATRSSLRAIISNYRQRTSISPLAQTPAVTNLRKKAVTYGCVERRYTMSDSQGGPGNRGHSSSLGIKKWIQIKQNSTSEENFYSVDEADDEGQPQGNYPLQNMREEAEKDFKKTRQRKWRRISEDLASQMKREWRTEIDLDISSESEACDQGLEEATNIEKRLLEVSSGLNPQAVREHRISALRSLLTTKNQPLTVLNLLEASKVAEAVALAKDLRVRLDVCLLWACLQGAADLVHSLLEEGANVDAKDCAGFSAMHLAAEIGSEEVIRVLINGKAEVGTSGDWDYNQEVTPLMLAARSGCTGGLEVLIKAGADVNGGQNSGKETALHHAVHAAIPESIQVLLSAGATPNSTVMYSETPLHIATYEGLIDIVDLLLNAGADVRASRGASKMTALHIAASEGYSAIAHKLIKAGANTNQDNLRGQTALHLAAKAQSYDTVQILISLGADPNACDRDHKTPLHTGIFKGSRSHECLRLLLEVGADTNAADLSGYTPLHMAALHDSSYCVLLFLDHGGDITACTQGGVSALNIILRRTPTVLGHLQENLDAAIGFSDQDHHDRESLTQLNFRVLVPPGEASGLECGMLSCFIREGQKKLLKHPLCETLLFLKWLKVRNFFIINLIFYALFVAMLTVYIMAVFPAASCFHLNSTTQVSVADGVDAKDIPPTPTSEENTEKREASGMKYKTYIDYLLYFIWLFVSLLGLKELFQIINTPPKTHFTACENIFIWPIIILTMILTITSYEKQDTEPWEHHLAAIVILMSWVQLLFLIARFPVFGLYVQMFTQVTKNFGKFLFVYLCLISAFSLSFGVLFPNHDPFKVYILRMVKTVVMMTGEIEYNDWFFDKNKTIMYPWTSHIIFAFFLIFVTVILMNLLVGLAVSDIQGLQKTAGLDTLVRETQQIAQFESIMFSKWLTWVTPKSILHLLHQRILICSSLYGWTLVLTPKTLSDTALPTELVEVIRRTARLRDHAARRRHTFTNYRSLSKRAQYSGEDGDVQTSVDALRFGLDLLILDADDRHEESVFLRKALTTLTEDIEKATKHVDTPVSGGICPNCRQEGQTEINDVRRSLYTSCETAENQDSTTGLAPTLVPASSTEC